MKHPSLKDLQEYFENETGEARSIDLSAHLKTCDKCTFVLSQMAKVDILISKAKLKEVPETLSLRVKARALEALREKRSELKTSRIHAEYKKERKEKIRNFISDYKANLFDDLKLPVMQASALFILMGVLTEVSRTEIIANDEKLINNEFKVYYSELEGELSEDI